MNCRTRSNDGTGPDRAGNFTGPLVKCPSPAPAPGTPPQQSPQVGVLGTGVFLACFDPYRFRLLNANSEE